MADYYFFLTAANGGGAAGEKKDHKCTSTFSGYKHENSNRNAVGEVFSSDRPPVSNTPKRLSLTSKSQKTGSTEPMTTKI